MLRIKDIDVSKLSPMMKEYIDLKDKYKDTIMMYRLGDFYEMFFDDAIQASQELELTLTGRACGLEERAPMCGVPYHSVEPFLNKLVKNGHKVAICEQLENPSIAKGLVKRDVVRVVTPGSTLSSDYLDSSKNNYIMSIYEIDNIFGVSLCDITTGEFLVRSVDSIVDLIELILKSNPSEIIYDLNNYDFTIFNPIKYNIAYSNIQSVSLDYNSNINYLQNQFNDLNVDKLELNKYKELCVCAVNLINYLEKLQKCKLEYLTSFEMMSEESFLTLDYSTRRNLELIETMFDKSKAGSFINVIDKTKTAMGARLLRKMVLEPLINRDEILKRQELIQELFDDVQSREDIRSLLVTVYDFERLLSRIIYKTANARDLISFKTSLRTLPDIKTLIAKMNCDYARRLCDELDVLDDLYVLIDDAIIDEPPFAIREGGFIKNGFNKDVDELRYAKDNGKSLLASIEEEEKENTGITNLKVKYNKVFGYFVEVSKGQLNKVPDYFVRKQTLTNAERFIVPKLKEVEDTILGANDKLSNLEYEIFCEIRDKIAENSKRIKRTANAISFIDTFCSLAHVSFKNSYVKPDINEDGILEIKDGRHPVIEEINKDDQFIPNDIFLDGNEFRVNIITGPNMAGKSTYMRQVALIQLMAQMGCFVPASYANVSIVDRIFTRVGASDDLATGKSTFMVEMSEVSNIIKNATNNSLIILDEIGRGTSTYDGLSIAWAVTEEINNNIKAKTLFATHYHELTALENESNGIHNFSIAVKEKGDDIIFLRKVIPGGADRSYGIQVAKLAGVPTRVIERSKLILNDLISSKNGEELNIINSSRDFDNQVSNFNNIDDNINDIESSKYKSMYEELKAKINEIDLNNSTPIQVINKVDEIKKDF